MNARVHGASGGVALLTISTFWLSTVVAKAFGSLETIAAVKTSILVGMAVLIPAMVMAGGSGFSLARGWKSPVVARKKARMKLIAANGMLILLPSALFLADRANSGQFDSAFTLVQALELAAGATNITLLALNMRDGLKMRRRATPMSVVRS